MYQRHVSDIMLGHETQGLKDTSSKRKEKQKKMQQYILQDFPRETATTSYQIKSLCLWELLLQLLSKGQEKNSFPVFTGKE